MSLNAWDWEEDTEGIDVMSSLMNFYPSEFDMDEYVKVKTFSQESDSERPCSSEMSTHAPSSFFQSDVPHVVPCRFIISLAFPAFGHKGKQYNVVDKNRRFPRIEKPTSKMRRFYHLEYYLLPDDIEPKMVDILLFPLVAKVFLDSGMKTVKLWGEGEKIWVSWPQTFNINMTKELLKKINFHSITLRLWDTKDKVSKKVRYYRMKPSGLSEDLGSFEEVKNLVLNQRRLSERHNHIKEELMSVMPLRKTEKSKKHKAGHEKETSPKSAGEHDKQTKMEDFSNSQWGVSGRLSIVGGVAGLAMKEIIERSSFGSLTNTYEKQKFPMRIRESGEKKKGQKKKKKLPTDEDVEPKSGSHWKPEVFSAHLPMTPLLAGTQNIVSHSSWKSATVLGCYLTLSTKVPIMTEDQRLELNPLTIKINCATCLPSQPVSIQELEKNIKDILKTSKRSLGTDVQVIRIPAAAQVHNYSIQTLNSTELARKLLYQQMAKEPSKRFTYSEKYFSAMVEPQDTKEEEKNARMQDRQAWLTPRGFLVTGLQKSGECHGPFRLLPLGSSEPEEEWGNRTLFQSMFQPVLDRDRWSWEQRHQDFELYKKPPPFLPLPPPPKPRREPKALPSSPVAQEQPRKHLFQPEESHSGNWP